MNSTIDRLRAHHQLSDYERGHKDAYEQGLSQILARLDRLENIAIMELLGVLKSLQMERALKQSTQDLKDAVTELTGTVNDVGTAIDALVAAQSSGDDAAVEEQVAALKALGPQLKGHLPVVAQTATTVAQSDADPAATVTP